MQKFLFAGSFNPFTIGHLSVYDTACTLFGRDNVFIGVAQNEQKTRCSLEFLRWTINPVSENVLVLPKKSLTADFCDEHNISCLIRSMRNTADFNYEVELASWNKELGVETVFIPTKTGLEKISSSSVRLLAQCGKNISPYLPELVHNRWLSRPKRILVTGFMGAGKSSFIGEHFFGKCSCFDMDKVAKEILSDKLRADIRDQIMRGEPTSETFSEAGQILVDEILKMQSGCVIEVSALGTYSSVCENAPSNPIRRLYDDSVIVDVEKFQGTRAEPVDEAFLEAALTVQKKPLVVDFAINSDAQNVEEITEISARSTAMMTVCDCLSIS